MRKKLTKNFWNIVVWAVQKHINLVDLVKSFPTNIFLQNSASIQKRPSPVKFAHLAEKSRKGSISNLSTKVATSVDPLQPSADGWPASEDTWPTESGKTVQGSFSAVSQPNFASKYSLEFGSLESSRRDLHNALLCTPLHRSLLSLFFTAECFPIFCQFLSNFLRF